eukprot:TRINITY_DN197_c0_g1_i7.p1 TRINITY_DN197_c0_g1~~TRINITY_DN197_c0_g1_i7.p1  ORF type:complete len:237 (-),score=86.14 TRINITY_DN197_c0_g1_i7:114-824(-)
MVYFKVFWFLPALLAAVTVVPEDSALEQDDECPQKEGASCALSALQLVGRRETQNSDELDVEELELDEAGPKKKCYEEGYSKIAACPQKKLKKFTEEDVKATCAPGCHDKLPALMKSCGMSEKKEKRLAKFCADPAASVTAIAKKHEMKKCIRKAVKATGKCPKHMKKILRTKSNAADVALACSDACKGEVVKAAEGCGAQRVAKKASKMLTKRCSSSLLQDDEESEDEDVEDIME